MFDPKDWYWKKSTGEVWGSARLDYVSDPTGDADYIAWSDLHSATPWPKDSAGSASMAALQAVLDIHSIIGFVSPGGTWQAATQADHLKAYLANKRWQVETGGTVVSGQAIPTGRNERTAIKQAHDELVAGTLTSPINFVLGDTVIAADQAMLSTFVTAIAQHVQSAYDIQATLLADINNGTVTTMSQIDAAGWPAN